MKHLLVIILVSLQLYGNCQSVQDLDNKNGFKKFILGEEKYKYFFYSLESKGSEKVAEKHIRKYRFIPDQEDSKVGLHRYDYAYLYFYDEQLYKIIIYVQTDEDLKGIFNALVKKYGRPTQGGLDLNDETRIVKIHDNLYSHFLCQWKGEKVRLSISTNKRPRSWERTFASSSSYPTKDGKYKTKTRFQKVDYAGYTREIIYINISLEAEILRHNNQYIKNKTGKAVDDL